MTTPILTQTLPPATTPAVARLLWDRALGEWGEHITSNCPLCACVGACRELVKRDEAERATWLAWLGARRLEGEAGL